MQLLTSKLLNLGSCIAYCFKFLSGTPQNPKSRAVKFLSLLMFVAINYWFFIKFSLWIMLGGTLFYWSENWNHLMKIVWILLVSCSMPDLGGRKSSANFSPASEDVVEFGVSNFRGINSCLLIWFYYIYAIEHDHYKLPTCVIVMCSKAICWLSLHFLKQ